jgi:GGDEF domain-containing protein
LCKAIAALTPEVTASIGVTSATLHDAPQPATVDYIDGLIGVADQAMYAAKRHGGNHARHRPSPVPEGPHSH